MKTKQAKATNYEQVTQGGKRRAGVQNFSDFASDDTHVHLQDMADQTIYIVKLEPLASDEYGAGFKLWFKDLPNAKATSTAGVFGQFPVAQLENLYNLTNKGERISLTSPVKTIIRKAGKTYRFE